MTSSLLRHILIFILLSGIFTGIHAQEALITGYPEQVAAVTDRTLYIAGETIHYTAILTVTDSSETAKASRIGYCELIKPDGVKITGRKFLFSQNSGTGSVDIPPETITGIYYLRFYTRYMRNNGPATYFYIRLKIINPYKSEILPEKTDNQQGVSGENQASPEGVLNSVLLATGKPVVEQGENLQITIKPEESLTLPGRLTLTVIPEPCLTDQTFRITEISDTIAGPYFCPEERGISLNGKLIAMETATPLKNTKVNLSIIGDKDFQVTHSDSSGRFAFSLPDYRGSRDVFICSDDLAGISPEILVGNDFCTLPFSIVSPPFSLDDKERAAALNLAMNLRISDVFNEVQATSDTQPASVNSFYGKPVEILSMDKYIELPTLEDYFTELPVIVKVRKSQGKKFFRFLDAGPEMEIYDPLVLVDWVAINDMKKILAMSPNELDRIELVNLRYRKGDVTYGGIISFISKKNDFAGIDLPHSGTFINYRFLDEYSPGNPGQPPTPGNPDARNTIYWGDLPAQDKASGITVSITAPETPGRYLILLRQITSSGKILSATATFDVVSR